MSFMDKAFARLYPRIIKGSEDKWLRDARAALLADASGDVVEIGAGTGLNIRHYPSAVTRLTVTEASAHMLPALERAVSRHRPSARVVRAPAEDLPLGDASADVVVSTLVLCSVTDTERALAEIRRVLRPDGRLLVLEHVLGSGSVAKWQRRSEPFTRFFGRGCHVTRDTRAALTRAGFDTSGLQDRWVDEEPAIYAPHLVGIAPVL